MAAVLGQAHLSPITWLKLRVTWQKVCQRQAALLAFLFTGPWPTAGVSWTSHCRPSIPLLSVMPLSTFRHCHLSRGALARIRNSTGKTRTLSRDHGYCYCFFSLNESSPLQETWDVRHSQDCSCGHGTLTRDDGTTELLGVEMVGNLRTLLCRGTRLSTVT